MNPGHITIHELTQNAAISRPDAQTIDTDGRISIEAGGKIDRMFLEVVNNSENGLTITVEAGNVFTDSEWPALQMQIEGGAGKIIGPLESMRYVKAGGWIDMQFEAETGSPDAALRVYRLAAQ